MVDHGRDATVARLEPVWRQTYLALTAGLRLADHLHNIAGWRPAADLHLHRQMTRREAMEHLKGLDPEELDDDDNFGLPMSGLLLRPSDSDVLRVWHSTDPSIPVRDSRPAREFCAQAPSRADVLPLPGLNVRTLSGACHTILHWTAQGTKIIRFDLVRPLGVDHSAVLVDWRAPLLGRLARVDDLPFRRRHERHEQDEEGSAAR